MGHDFYVIEYGVLRTQPTVGTLEQHHPTWFYLPGQLLPLQRVQPWTGDPAPAVLRPCRSKVPVHQTDNIQLKLAAGRPTAAALGTTCGVSSLPTSTKYIIPQHMAGALLSTPQLVVCRDCAARGGCDSSQSACRNQRARALWLPGSLLAAYRRAHTTYVAEQPVPDDAPHASPFASSSTTTDVFDIDHDSTYSVELGPKMVRELFDIIQDQPCRHEYVVLNRPGIHSHSHSHSHTFVTEAA